MYAYRSLFLAYPKRKHLLGYSCGTLPRTRFARTRVCREVFFVTRMESADALPVADEARRFRGSAPIGVRE